MTSKSLYEQGNNLTLFDALRYQTQQQPQQPALIFLADGENECGRLTYAELDHQARAIASRLVSLKATGKCAVLLYPPGLEFIAAFWGCLYAGVIGIPVYPPKHNRNQMRLSGIIKDARAAFALSTGSELQRWDLNSGPTQELASCHWLATDNLENNELEYAEPVITPDSLAFLQYSSGSTGLPKGIMVSHGNLVHNLEYIRRTYGFEEDSISVSWLPFFHDMGLILGILEPLYAGIPAVLMPPAAFTQRPLRWLWAISHYRATHAGGPNFGFDLCVRRIAEVERDTLDLRAWRNAYNGAEPVRKSTLEQFTQFFAPCGFQKKFFYPCYGLAEFTLVISGGSVHEEPVYLDVKTDLLEQNQAVAADQDSENAQSLVSCGRVGADIQLAIVDPETLTSLEPGRVGEIWVASRSVAQGYLKRPEETENTFHACLTGTTVPHFLRTGDLGFLKDGELFIAGRLKDVIIIRGRNLYPQDIELTAEQSHSSLRPGYGAAFRVTVDDEEQLVVAYEVERTMLRAIDIPQVIDAIRKSILKEYELRAHDVVLLKTGAIPKTSSGKIQRQACRTAYLGGKLDIIGQYQQASGKSIVVNNADGNQDEIVSRTLSIVTQFVSQTHKRLVQATCESRIHSDLALDSLDVTVLLDKLGKEMGVEIDLTKVACLHTVDDLVHIVRVAREHGANDAMSRERLPPISCTEKSPLRAVL
jgi:acyl-CoA synthetase (AMP-forming)/AMP-acid ligase II/acyl carrier protein